MLIFQNFSVASPIVNTVLPFESVCCAPTMDQSLEIQQQVRKSPSCLNGNQKITCKGPGMGLSGCYEGRVGYGGGLSDERHH